MRYFIKKDSENNITQVARIKPDRVKVIKKGRIVGYTRNYRDLKEDEIEITEEQYKEYSSKKGILYCKWGENCIVEEDEETKRQRYSYNLAKKEEATKQKEKEDLKELLLKLKGYVKFNKKGLDLINE